MGKRCCAVGLAMIMVMGLASLTLATSRRSMLTNGIGLTPPMGYAMFASALSVLILYVYSLHYLFMLVFGPVACHKNLGRWRLNSECFY